MENGDGILTIDELAEYLKIPKSILYKLVLEERIPGQKIGRHWRFSKEATDKWREEAHKKQTCQG